MDNNSGGLTGNRGSTGNSGGLTGNSGGSTGNSGGSTGNSGGYSPSSNENSSGSKQTRGSASSSGPASGAGGSGDDPPEELSNSDSADFVGEDEEQEETEENESEEEDAYQRDVGVTQLPNQEVPGQAGAGVVQPEGNSWLSYESLMQDTLPLKSKVVYLAAYSDFEKFLKRENKFVPDLPPSELMLMNYFFHLKSVKFFAPTTIWSIYSRINAVFKRRFSISLKSFPSITDMLKSYSSGHRLKKSAVFSPQQERL